MSIDYDGCMIVGRYADDISDWLESGEDPDDPWDLLENSGMTHASLYYDAPIREAVIGFRVDDVMVNSMTEGWLDTVVAHATKFEELTGVPAKLIGTQNIW